MGSEDDGNGRKVVGFNLKPQIAEEFMDICRREGLIASRQIEIMLTEFIERKRKEKENKI